MDNLWRNPDEIPGKFRVLPRALSLTGRSTLAPFMRALPVGRTLNSTRRLVSRPSSLELSAMGWVSP